MSHYWRWGGHAAASCQLGSYVNSFCHSGWLHFFPPKVGHHLGTECSQHSSSLERDEGTELMLVPYSVGFQVCSTLTSLCQLCDGWYWAAIWFFSFSPLQLIRTLLQHCLEQWTHIQIVFWNMYPLHIKCWNKINKIEGMSVGASKINCSYSSHCDQDNA